MTGRDRGPPLPGAGPAGFGSIVAGRRWRAGPRCPAVAAGLCRPLSEPSPRGAAAAPEGSLAGFQPGPAGCGNSGVTGREGGSTGGGGVGAGPEPRSLAAWRLFLAPCRVGAGRMVREGKRPAQGGQNLLGRVRCAAV